MLHLIREASLERAIADYQVDQIPARNIALMKNLGQDKLQALLNSCFNERDSLLAKSARLYKLIYCPTDMDPRRCNCSICRRKGTIVASVPLAALRIVKGEAKLSLYRYDSKEAEHYFYSVCGIYTHHKRRSNPNQSDINSGCLEGVDPNLIEGIKIYDGADNHPSD